MTLKHKRSQYIHREKTKDNFELVVLPGLVKWKHNLHITYIRKILDTDISTKIKCTLCTNKTK